MAMQFNPYKTSAVPIGSNQSVIAQLTGQVGNAIGGLGQSVQDVGTGIRSSKVAELIGSGALKGMNEQQARQAITLAGQGAVDKQTQSNINTLLGGKQSAEQAKVLADAKLMAGDKANALTQLGIKSREDIAKRSDATSRANVKTTTDLSSSNRLLNEMADIESAKVAQKNKLEQLGLQASLKPGAKTDVKDIAKDIKTMGGIDEMIDSAQNKISDRQTFVERDYSQKSKDTVKGAVKSSILNNKYLADQFRIDPEGFTTMVIDQLGTTDESLFNPFGEDEWIPNITKDTIADLEKKLKAMKGK